jgi:hypothetical protein
MAAKKPSNTAEKDQSSVRYDDCVTIAISPLRKEVDRLAEDACSRHDAPIRMVDVPLASITNGPWRAVFGYPRGCGRGVLPPTIFATTGT